MTGGSGDPKEREPGGGIGVHADPVFQHHGDGEKRRRMALLGGRLIPAEGTDEIDGNDLAPAVLPGQLVLGLGIPGVGEGQEIGNRTGLRRSGNEGQAEGQN